MNKDHQSSPHRKERSWDDRLDAWLSAKPFRARSDFADRTLERLARRHANRHIDRRIDALLSEKTVAVSEDFTVRAMRQIQESIRAVRRKRQTFASMAAAILAGAALFLAIPNVQRGPSHDTGIVSIANTANVEPSADGSVRDVAEEHLLTELFFLAEGLEGAGPLLEGDALEALEIAMY